MKTHWKSGGTTPRILILRTGWSWVVSFAPRPLHSLGERTPHTIE